MKTNDNLILRKSYDFSLEIVKLNTLLTTEMRQYELARQVLRSGTSICANVEEAQGGVSRKDFAHKMSIAYKEARETKYWLRLLNDSGIIVNGEIKSLLDDCEELLKLLYTIINTARRAIIDH
jgi:four helix bundle protein